MEELRRLGKMRLMIERTDVLIAIDGVPCRLWKGTTEDGAPLDVFVHLIGADDTNAQAACDRELLEQAAPTAIVVR